MFLLICIFSCSCTLNGGALRTQLAGNPGITGTCTVILYGAHYYNNIATVALIIPDGGKYLFDIYSPDYNYRSIKKVAGADAFEMARKFVSWHPDFIRSQTSEVLDNDGHVIAYEVRPLYNRVAFGMNDVMYVNYFLERDNKVVVHINLNEGVEKVFMGDDQGKVH